MQNSIAIMDRVNPYLFKQVTLWQLFFRVAALLRGLLQWLLDADVALQ
jgi:hypothetical protein